MTRDRSDMIFFLLEALSSRLVIKGVISLSNFRDKNTAHIRNSPCCRIWKPNFLHVKFTWTKNRVYHSLYNNQINARALIGQSAVVYCASKPMEKSRVFFFVNHARLLLRKSLACGSWFTNSSRVLPTSRVVYQPITYRNLWSIA